MGLGACPRSLSKRLELDVAMPAHSSETAAIQAWNDARLDTAYRQLPRIPSGPWPSDGSKSSDHGSRNRPRLRTDDFLALGCAARLRFRQAQEGTCDECRITTDTVRADSARASTK